MKKPLILVGAGGHAKSCIDVIESTGLYEIAGLVDKELPKGEKVLGYPVLGNDDALPELVKKYKNFLITLGHMGNVSLRKKLFEEIKNMGGVFPSVIAATAYVSKYAEIGEGTIVMHHALVNASAKVGVNCIINTKALVEHDAVIGDGCHISTASVVNGGVCVGEGSFAGSNCIIKQGVTVPENTFIKAGSIFK